MNLGTFLKELSSRAATPGGGAAAGLVAAMGASLGAMVAALSQGIRYTSVADSMKKLEERFLESRDRCLIFANQDSAAFQRWMAAARMSFEDPSAREEALRAAMEEACRLPMALGEEVSGLQSALATLQEHGNVRVLSDVGAALALLSAALEISILNLRINQQGIADPCLRGKLMRSIESFDRTCAVMREWESQIRSRLEGEEWNE
ncbi:MAG: cyclodeaminase/cyclohydrolase family protein [Coprothermobacterota bacterium]|nr:cyclodeaminase/cyclohydrolase family protein [Coprothermobacterota bacterium]